MKHLFSLFLCACATSALAADVSIAGKWDVATSVAGNDGSAVCTFVEKDGALSGACKGDDGEHPLTGKIEGSKVTWSYKSDYNGQPLTISFTGTLNSDKEFKGVVDVEPMGVDGDFTARRKE